MIYLSESLFLLTCLKLLDFNVYFFLLRALQQITYVVSCPAFCIFPCFYLKRSNKLASETLPVEFML